MSNKSRTKKANVLSKTIQSKSIISKENTTIIKKNYHKSPTKFQIHLNDEQKEAKKIILKNDVIVLTGKSGSGKTLLACQASLDALYRNQIENIYITRPTVSNKEDLGFLPGDLSEKMGPWLEPIYENLKALVPPNLENKDNISIDKLIEDEIIKISPIAFMRGRTKLNSYIIVDECQNITKDQMIMILTRLGKDSKLIFCGDSAQIDLRNKKDSGLNYLIDLGQGIKGFDIFELKTNHRHPIVNSFLEKIDMK